MRWAIFLLAASLFTPTVGAQEGRLASPPKTIAATKLVYLSGNFMNPEEVDRCRKVMKEAAALGYTGVVVTDCKFDRWEETVTVRRPQYEANVRRLREAARQYKLQLIACVCGQGSDLLANDPNLAEGMPVQEAPFVVQGGRLVPADHDLRLVNLGLEAGSNGRVGGWSVDEVGAVDTQVKVEGKNSIRFQAIKANSSHGNGRIIQAVEVKPFRYYHLSIQVKTRDFDAPGTFNFMALGSRAGTASQQGLVHQHFDLKPTQDWTRFDIVFNTLDSERRSASTPAPGAATRARSGSTICTSIPAVSSTSFAGTVYRCRSPVRIAKSSMRRARTSPGSSIRSWGTRYGPERSRAGTRDRRSPCLRPVVSKRDSASWPRTATP